MRLQTLRHARGFTLIELLIAVAVIGILAAVALPAYNDYIKRGKVASALAEMTAYRVRLEQYYQDFRNYGSTASVCGVAVPSATGFTFTCSHGTTSNSQSFVVTATGQAAQGMSGFEYTVNNQDEQKTVQFFGDTVDVLCWLKKKGDSC